VEAGPDAAGDKSEWGQSETGFADLIGFTRAGEIICDPCMGGETTRVAALRLGRFFIGVEKDPAAFKVAKARIGSAA